MLDDENSSPSLGTTSSSIPESVKKYTDNLAKDLEKIIIDSSYDLSADRKMAAVDVINLVQALAMYIVDCDYKVLRHGVDIQKSR